MILFFFGEEPDGLYECGVLVVVLDGLIDRPLGME